MDNTMLTNIENNAVALLKSKLEGASRIAVDEAHSAFNLKMPSIEVILGDGTFTKPTQSWKYHPQIFVIVSFQNVQSVEMRRRGVYPILLGVMMLLIGQKLELKIDPLKPKRVDNITTETDADEGKIIIQIEFETGFMISALSDEEISDLLTVGLNYYLQDPADDEVADASDDVTLAES